MRERGSIRGLTATYLSTADCVVAIRRHEGQHLAPGPRTIIGEGWLMPPTRILSFKSDYAACAVFVQQSIVNGGANDLIAKVMDDEMRLCGSVQLTNAGYSIGGPTRYVRST